MQIEKLSNKANVFHAIYDEMVSKYRAEKRDEAEGLAHQLISHADLPAIIKARCLMVLATGPENSSTWAQMAVKEMEELIDVLGGIGSAPQYEKDVFVEAKALLEQVKAIEEEQAEQAVGGEEVDVEAEEEEEEEQGEDIDIEMEEDDTEEEQEPPLPVVETTVDEYGNVVEVKPEEEEKRVTGAQVDTTQLPNIPSSPVKGGLPTPAASRNPTRENPDDKHMKP